MWVSLSDVRVGVAVEEEWLSWWGGNWEMGWAGVVVMGRDKGEGRRSGL